MSDKNEQLNPDLYFLDNRQYIHSSTIIALFNSLHPDYNSLNLKFYKLLTTNPTIRRVANNSFDREEPCFFVSLIENQEEFNYVITESGRNVTSRKATNYVEPSYIYNSEGLIIESFKCNHEDEFIRIVLAVKNLLKSKTRQTSKFLVLNIILHENLYKAIPYAKIVKIKNNIGNKLYGIQVSYCHDNSTSPRKLIDCIIKKID